MIAASLAVLVVLGQAPAPDPSALVTQLGSRRYAEREAAATRLEQIGRQALPALRTARASRDLEIRTRAVALVSRIEGALLTQPTLITLDYQDRPLLEVLKGVGEQAGVKLSPINERDPGFASRRITLRESAPLPFWKAIDRLCDAGHLQYNPMGFQAHPVTREPIIPLFHQNGPAAQAATPRCDAGPFRVSLVNLHFQRDVYFGQGTAIPVNPGFLQPRALAPQPNPAPLAGHATNEQFSAQIQLTAEPRLSLAQNGPLRVLEAVDERGQSLLIPQNDGAFTQRVSGYFGMTSGSTLPLQVPLSHPSVPSRTIKRLRGTLSVVVSTRKPDPLVVPLGNAAGKSFQNDDVTLTVQDVRTNPNTRQLSLDLAIRPNGSTPGSATGTGLQGDFIPQRPDMHQQQIEILDAQGRALPWFNTSYDAEGTRLTLTLVNQHDQATPTEIRYYTLARAATDVNFAFEDVPMP